MLDEAQSFVFPTVCLLLLWPRSSAVVPCGQSPTWLSRSFSKATQTQAGHGVEDDVHGPQPSHVEIAGEQRGVSPLLSRGPRQVTPAPAPAARRPCCPRTPPESPGAGSSLDLHGGRHFLGCPCYQVRPLLQLLRDGSPARWVWGPHRGAHYHGLVAVGPRLRDTLKLACKVDDKCCV